MSLTPTQRTLRHLRNQGWICDIVERFNPYAGPYGKRIDAFHFMDILCMAENGIVAVQSCGQNFAEHEKNILSNSLAYEWLRCGGRLLLIGWRKVKKKRGGKLLVWAPRIKEFDLQDFEDYDKGGKDGSSQQE